MATGKKRRRYSKDGLYKRDGSNLFWTRIPGQGRVSTGLSDREAARIWRSRKLREAADPAHAAATRTTVAAMIAQAIDAVRLREGRGGGPITDKTIRYYEDKLAPFARLLGEERPLLEVDYDVIGGEYIVPRKREGGSTAGTTVTKSTMGKELKALRFALKIQRARGAYPHDVDHVTRLRAFASKGKECTRALEWPEVGALLLAFGNYGRKAGKLNARQLLQQTMRVQQVAWHVVTGGRFTESEGAEMKDHDLVNWRVFIRGTKTVKSRGWIPIAPAFRPLLGLALSGRPKTGKLFRPWSNFNRALKRAAERAGIERLSTNDLRRTHMTMLSNAGIPNEALKNVSRHATTVMLDRHYVRKDMVATEKALEHAVWDATLNHSPVTVE